MFSLSLCLYSQNELNQFLLTAKNDTGEKRNSITFFASIVFSNLFQS
jgi:hypothetical protein